MPVARAQKNRFTLHTFLSGTRSGSSFFWGDVFTRLVRCSGCIMLYLHCVCLNVQGTVCTNPSGCGDETEGDISGIFTCPPQMDKMEGTEAQSVQPRVFFPGFGTCTDSFVKGCDCYSYCYSDYHCQDHYSYEFIILIQQQWNFLTILEDK